MAALTTDSHRVVWKKFGVCYRLEKYKEARMDGMFPDEIDTPQDIPARERFQRWVQYSSSSHFL